MSNHMPAPWSIDLSQRGPVQIKSRHGFQVGTALTVDDARLMAAAPEMLAALQVLHEDLARYSKMTEGVWSSGSIALGSLADMCAMIVTRVEGREPKPPGCQHCGEPHGVSVPCGFRRTDQ